MDKPEVAEARPAVLDLEAGTYWWCACGKSQSQPWCDGSHKGSGFTPVKVEIEAAKRVALCQCKQSAASPFCDGTHNKL